MTTREVNPLNKTEWYRSRSLWLSQVGTLEPRAQLNSDIDTDVAIVGGGLLGIWTAYYLSHQDPSLHITVLERETVGFGAAGRNGGWAGAGIAGSAKVFAKIGGATAVKTGAQLFRDAVQEIGAVVDDEAIECGYNPGGTLTIATTQPQLARLQSDFRSPVAQSLRAPDEVQLTAAEVGAHLHAPRVLGGAFSPHCARVQPAQLVRGLAETIERGGVTIFEQTTVTSTRPGIVETTAGVVRARHIVMAAEAWLPQQPGHKRDFLPLSSMMIATEPLSESVWDDLGWAHGLTIRDRRHLFFYAQRTPDNRLAIGGRGAPYRLRTPFNEFDGQQDAVFARLTETMHQHFPQTRDATITHRWGGLLGVPRDWSMAVRYDRSTGMGFAGGFAGHGVIAAYLAGRTLADLIVGQESTRTRMPWVGRTSPKWEPEPLRYLASNSIVNFLMGADGYEDRTGRTARRANLVKPFLPPG